jgi:hypothetical protein
LLAKPLSQFKAKHATVEINGTLKIGDFEVHMSHSDVGMDGTGRFAFTLGIGHTCILFRMRPRVTWFVYELII